MAVLTNPKVLLNVNLGGRYGAVEADRLQTPPGMHNRLVRVDLPTLGDLYELPKKSYILPARNALLTLIAAQYGNRILMGSIAASQGSDKDQEFADRMTNLMEWVWQPQEMWNPHGRSTRLELPVQHYTKARLVAATMRHGISGETIRDSTFSCYTPTAGGTECGKCAPCARKWGALAANDIDPGFDGREAFRRYVDEIDAAGGNTPKHRTPEYVEDTLRAWESNW